MNARASHYRGTHAASAAGAAPSDDPVMSAGVKRWRLSEIDNVLPRRYMLRQCALELFFGDGGQMLVALASQKDRDRCSVRLQLVPRVIDMRFVCWFAQSKTPAAAWAQVVRFACGAAC